MQYSNVRRVIDRACRRLLVFDPGIVEVIVFGSIIYAPNYARDIDLLIITGHKKNYLEYLKVIDDLPLNIDLSIFSTNERPRNDFLLHLLLGYEILYGSGKIVKEWLKSVSLDIEEVYSRLRIAKRYFQLAFEVKNRYDRDTLIRDAFNSLFHAYRLASAIYLGLKREEAGRWGKEIRRNLPLELKREFEEAIRVLHIDYYYNGNYPHEDEELRRIFEQWLKKAEKYVKKTLESNI